MSATPAVFTGRGFLLGSEMRFRESHPVSSWRPALQTGRLWFGNRFASCTYSSLRRPLLSPSGSAKRFASVAHEEAPGDRGRWGGGVVAGCAPADRGGSDDRAVFAGLVANSAVETLTARAFQDERLPSDGRFAPARHVGSNGEILFFDDLVGDAFNCDGGKCGGHGWW